MGLPEFCDPDPFRDGASYVTDLFLVEPQEPRALLRSWSALFARWSAVCSSKSKKQVLSLTALAVRNSVPPFRGRYGVHTSNGPHGGGRGSSRLFTPLSESHRIDRWCCMGQEMRAESTAREPDARGEAAAAKRGERRCCGISPPAGSEQTSRLRRAGPGTQPLCILPVPCRLLLLLPLALAQFFVVFVVPPVKIGSHGWPRWGPMDEPYIWGPNVGVPTVA
jgi:hypothetical protein